MAKKAIVAAPLTTRPTATGLAPSGSGFSWEMRRISERMGRI